MNKIYRARVVWYHYLYLIFLMAIMVAFFLNNQIMAGAIFTLWFIYVMEKVFHTVYTVTPDGFLLIYNGKFKKGNKIKIDEIEGISELFMFKVRGVEFTRFLLFKHQDRYYSLLPKQGDELLNLLTKI